MFAIDWSWASLVGSAVGLVLGGVGLWLIRGYGPTDPYPWDPEGEE